MPELTTRQKLSLTFGSYFFLLLLLVSLTFIGVFHYLFVAQIRTAVGAELNEIIRNHILLTGEQIGVTSDQAGIPLTAELQENDSSALILDQNLQMVNGFGLFQFYKDEDQATIYSIALQAKDAKNSKKTVSKNIPWRGKNLFVLAAPLENQGRFLGILVLARPLSQVEAADRLILLVLAILSSLGFAGSLVLGWKMADHVLRPIKKMTGVIETIDLDKLDQKLSYVGHKSDELTILVSRFNSMLTRLQSMSEQQREFISNASHELRTPLTRVISSLEILASKIPKTVKVELGKIIQDLFSLNDLLVDLLTLSRLQRQNLGPVGPVEISGVLEESLRKLQPEMRQKDIRVAANLAQHSVALLPREYLRLIFFNLLSNAIKYSPPGSRIKIDTLRLKNHLRLVVSDRGIGMTKDEKLKVFDRFFRSAGARVQGTGQGIGLAIVKRICDLYGIKIDVNSKKDVGSEFGLLFPVSRNI